MPFGVRTAESITADLSDPHATGRGLAGRALRACGAPTAPVGRGAHGEPLWPPGILGSITHCEGYVAAAVAPRTLVGCLGIDAEPARPLPPGVLEEITGGSERERIARLTTRPPDVHWDRLVFCTKEAVYKAWFPREQSWLDYADIQVAMDRDGTVWATVGSDGLRASSYSGRWLQQRDLLVVAITVVGARAVRPGRRRPRWRARLG